MEQLVPEVRWLNCRNSGSGNHHRIGVSAQTTEIVAPTIADRSVSPTIIPLSMKYFGVSFRGYALEIYIYIYIYILFTIGMVNDIKF